MRSFLLALFASSITFSSLAQSGPAAPTATAPVAYETATLPEDKAQAWAMLRAATGLGDESLQPWYLHARFKTFNAYGKPEGEGTMEYVWAGPKQWRESLTQGAITYTVWKTAEGFYMPAGQSLPPYPARLVPPEFLYPLGLGDVAKKTPPFMAKERFGTTKALCFLSGPLQGAAVDERAGKSPDFTRVCTLPDKPVLLMTQWVYDVFFNEFVSFQHHIVAQRILIKLGGDSVVDIQIDALRLLGGRDQSLLIPPPDASPLQKIPNAQTIHENAFLNKVKPVYPEQMKKQRVQGLVLLSVAISKDGTTAIKEVLHSPSPELTKAAEEAVKQWVYKPYLRDGVPVDVATEVAVTFMLN